MSGLSSATVHKPPKPPLQEKCQMSDDIRAWRLGRNKKEYKVDGDEENRSWGYSMILVAN